MTGIALHVIDADKIGHQLLSKTEIQTRLREHFGDRIFSDSTTVDRTRLAEIVFGKTAKHHDCLQTLNSILHPAIRQEIHSQIRSAPRDVDAVILDAALLLEGGWDAHCDYLIFVDVPLETRIQRVQENRGWSAQELAEREAAQWDVNGKKDRADFVVDNSRSIDVAAEQMTRIFQSIMSQTG